MKKGTVTYTVDLDVIHGFNAIVDKNTRSRVIQEMMRNIAAENTSEQNRDISLLREELKRQIEIREETFKKTAELSAQLAAAEASEDARLKEYWKEKNKLAEAAHANRYADPMRHPDFPL
jgi:hypothetical protein